MRDVTLACVCIASLWFAAEIRGDPSEVQAPAERRLSDEETKRLWDEGNKVAQTIRQELGGTGGPCGNLPSHACVYVILKGKRVNDATLVRLGQLPRIGELDLTGAAITDAGLESLKGLNELRGLVLGDTQITDAGLIHLKGLAHLRSLDLSDTKVTDAGVEHLKGLTQLRVLWLVGTGVTDTGLERLKGLRQLKELYLSDTGVTDAAVKRLRQALPRCDVETLKPAPLMGGRGGERGTRAPIDKDN